MYIYIMFTKIARHLNNIGTEWDRSMQIRENIGEVAMGDQMQTLAATLDTMRRS